MPSEEYPPEYTGPSVPHMLATRTIASCVIAQHGTPNEIFDKGRLGELRDFVADVGAKDTLLNKLDMLDTPGARPGTRAAEKGSLTGLIIARYGTSETAMGEEDADNLRKWFEGGGAGI